MRYVADQICMLACIFTTQKCLALVDPALFDAVG